MRFHELFEVLIPEDDEVSLCVEKLLEIVKVVFKGSLGSSCQ